VVGVFHLGESAPGAVPTAAGQRKAQPAAALTPALPTARTAPPARPAVAAAATLGRVRESARREVAAPARTNERARKPMNERTSERTSERTNERASGQTNGQTSGHARVRPGHRDAQTAAAAARPALPECPVRSAAPSDGDWETF